MPVVVLFVCPDKQGTRILVEFKKKVACDTQSAKSVATESDENKRNVCLSQKSNLSTGIQPLTGQYSFCICKKNLILS
jgi:hypothetical protein